MNDSQYQSLPLLPRILKKPQHTFSWQTNKMSNHTFFFYTLKSWSLFYFESLSLKTLSLDSQFSFFMSEPNFPNSSLMGLSSISLCIPMISIYNNLLKVSEFYQQNKYMKFHVLLTVLGQEYTVSLVLQLKYDFEALSWKIWWIWWIFF